MPGTSPGMTTRMITQDVRDYAPDFPEDPFRRGGLGVHIGVSSAQLRYDTTRAHARRAGTMAGRIDTKLLKSNVSGTCGYTSKYACLLNRIIFGLSTA
jgi:hypothetical protein